MEREGNPGESSRVIRILIICAVLGGVYALVIFWISPGKYKSTTVIEFRPDLQLGESADEQFLPGEVAFLQSGETLEVLAESLDLPREWRHVMDSVILTLDSIVTVEPAKEEKRVKVSVVHPDPKEAQMIAHAVPSAYAWRKQELRKELLKRQLAQVENEIVEEEDLLVAGQRKLRALADGIEVPYQDGKLLTRELYSEFFKALPQSEQSERAEEWADFEASWATHEKISETISGLREAGDKLKNLEPFEPVVVHEEANVPTSASLDELWFKLYWGVGKGLILGGLVLGIRHLFFRKPAEGDDKSERPRRTREAEPGDVW